LSGYCQFIAMLANIGAAGLALAFSLIDANSTAAPYVLRAAGGSAICGPFFELMGAIYRRRWDFEPFSYEKIRMYSLDAQICGQMLATATGGLSLIYTYMDYNNWKAFCTAMALMAATLSFMFSVIAERYYGFAEPRPLVSKMASSHNEGGGSASSHSERAPGETDGEADTVRRVDEHDEEQGDRGYRDTGADQKQPADRDRRPAGATGKAKGGLKPFNQRKGQQLDDEDDE
jgi:hypothetical protein